MPQKKFIGMRDIRAYAWIKVEDKPVTLRVEARCQSGEAVRVQLRDAGKVASEKAAGLPLAEATIIFGDQYPRPPVPAAFSLKNRRPGAIAPADLYTTGMMLGPLFQGVTSVDWVGDDGIECTVQVLPFSGFFKSPLPPSSSAIRF